MKKMITEFDKLLTHKKEIAINDPKIKKKSILMNPSRCVIYEFLCRHPCSSVSNIAKGLQVSESRVRWHLDKLVFDRFVTIQENGNTIFFPTNMIKPEHIKIFKLMALEKSAMILASIKSNEGVCQSELSKELDLNIRTVMKYTSDLEYFGLIRGSSDGKYKRYYLTDKIDKLKNYYKKNAKNFKEYIVKRTKMEGLRPRIILSTPEFLRLKLDAGIKIRVLNIPLIPFDGEKHGLRNIRNIAKERYSQKKSLVSLTSYF